MDSWHKYLLINIMKLRKLKLMITPLIPIFLSTPPKTHFDTKVVIRSEITFARDFIAT